MSRKHIFPGEKIENQVVVIVSCGLFYCSFCQVQMIYSSPVFPYMVESCRSDTSTRMEIPCRSISRGEEARSNCFSGRGRYRCRSYDLGRPRSFDTSQCHSSKRSRIIMKSNTPPQALSHWAAINQQPKRELDQDIVQGSPQSPSKKENFE